MLKALVAAFLILATPALAHESTISKLVCFLQTREDIKATARKLAQTYQEVEIKTDPYFTKRYYSVLESMHELWRGINPMDQVPPYHRVRGTTVVVLFESTELKGTPLQNTYLYAMFINENTCERPVHRLHYQLHKEVMKKMRYGDV